MGTMGIGRVDSGNRKELYAMALSLVCAIFTYSLVAHYSSCGMDKETNIGVE